MTRLTIEIININAIKILQDLEELKIIRIVKTPAKLSFLRTQIKTKMTNHTINQQISELRDEWKRDIK